MKTDPLVTKPREQIIKEARAAAHTPSTPSTMPADWQAIAEQLRPLAGQSITLPDGQQVAVLAPAYLHVPEHTGKTGRKVKAFRAIVLCRIGGYTYANVGQIGAWAIEARIDLIARPATGRSTGAPQAAPQPLF